uniref:Glycosyl transferase 64 domain-containing protein n=1 Tax=Neobodo designis TaxID=312471 RepID=A0A7S1MT41_NEODS
MSATANPRGERRLICCVFVVASCMVLAVLTNGMHGGEHVIAPTEAPRPSLAATRGPARTEKPSAFRDIDVEEEHVSTTAANMRGEPRQPLAAAATPSAVDYHGRVRGKATFVTMSYPKSSRHHRLLEILKRVFVTEFGDAGTNGADASGVARGGTYGEVISEGLLVWNGDEARIPKPIIEIAKSIGGTSGEPRRIDVTDPENAISHVLDFGRRFRILIAKANAIDNRWRIGAFIRTDIVLSVDDDIDLAPEGAGCLLDVRHAATGAFTLVGIDVRAHCVHPQRSCKDHEYDRQTGQVVNGPPAGHGPYGYAARHILPSGGGGGGRLKHYSVVLPRALVLTKALMLEYDRASRDGSSSSHGIRGIVDELKCDDIALNFVAANASSATGGGYGPWRQATAVYVKAKYRAYPEGHAKDSLTHQDGMKAMRQKCVNRLARLFSRKAAGSIADEDAAEDALGVDDGVPRHRTWFVSCNVDG